MIDDNRNTKATAQGPAVLTGYTTGGVKKTNLESLRLEGRIDGPLAGLNMTQVFRIEGDGIVDARYTLPLSGDAIVTRITISHGERTMGTRMIRRKDVISNSPYGHKLVDKASMLPKGSVYALTFSLGAVEPGTEVTVSTEFVQLGELSGGSFRYRVPLMPPVLNHRNTGDPHRGPARGMGADVTYDLSINLVCEKGSLSSETHNLRSGDDIYSSDDPAPLPHNDIQLTWTPGGLKNGFMALAGKGRRKPYLALVKPDEPSTPTLPRDILVLIDRSGSMDGLKRAVADQVIEGLLSSLKEGDVFNICLFHSKVMWFREAPASATEQNIEEAKSLLKDDSSGGTRMLDAFTQALDQARSFGDVGRHLVVITDGQVHRLEEVLRLMEPESKHSERRRCSLICIDPPSINHNLRQFARRAGGQCHFLFSSMDQDDMSNAIEDALSFLGPPIAVNSIMETDRPTLDSWPAEDGWHRSDLGDLVPGRPIWVSGLFNSRSGGPRFRYDGREMEAEESSMVNALHSAMLIGELEALLSEGIDSREAYRSLRRMGYSTSALRKECELVNGYPNWGDMKGIIRSLLVSESLRSGVLSSETCMAFLGEDGEDSVVETIMVTDLDARGWDQATPLPATRPSILSTAGCFVHRPSSFLEARTPAEVSFEDRVGYRRNGSGGIKHEPWVLYEGNPKLLNGCVVLHDAPYQGTVSRIFTRIHLTFEEMIDDATMEVLLFVEDMSVPCIRTNVKNLISQDWQQPLDVRIMPGQEVRLILTDGDSHIGGVKVWLE